MAVVEEGGEDIATGRTPDELVRLHVSYAVTRDKRLRHELALAYTGLADRLAAEIGRGEAARRAARGALARAIDRYDDGRHGNFREWASARIRAELRRLERAPSPEVPPGLLEDRAHVLRTVEDLGQELGRSPNVPEISARSGLSEDRVLSAMELIGPLDD